MSQQTIDSVVNPNSEILEKLPDENDISSRQGEKFNTNSIINQKINSFTKNPFYKQWWFITICVIALIGILFNPNKEKNNDDIVNEKIIVNPTEKAEIENWLARGNWTCTDVLKGTAPFMRGAMFSFNNGRLVISGGGTTVTNDYVITGILKNVPENTKYSALVKINNNVDMLTRIDENLMVLSWGEGQARLQLQR